MNALAEELARLTSIGEHHRRLVSRLALIVIATGVVDVLGAIAMYEFEHSADGTDVSTFGQALFFTTAQLLTVSSSAAEPGDVGRPRGRPRIGAVGRHHGGGIGRSDGELLSLR